MSYKVTRKTPVTKLLKLRPYQTEAIASVFGAIDSGTMRPAVVSPTGSGKTVMFAHIADQWARAYGTRTLVLVHRDELVRQAANKLRAVAPDLTTGIVKARENETRADVIVASVQTLASLRRRDEISGVGLVIVDEAHHAAANTYQEILRHFGCLAEVTPAVGFSATLTHSDKNTLARTWDRVVFERDILDMIPEYLCDVRGSMVTIDGLSLADIRTVRGDFETVSLSEAMLQDDVVSAVVSTWQREASDRQTLVFVPSVAATAVYRRAFEAIGVTTGFVTGTMPDEERKLMLKRFASGDIQVMVNCMVLTEGFDEPSVSCAIIARPTQSAALYIQMVGRILRLHPGKTDALVLDVVGASQDHRLATIADLTTKRLKEVRPGETLLAAVARERAEGNPSLADYVVSTRDVDLFHRSRALWLQTYEGVWFIQTRSTVWFLWPDDGGTYAVAWRRTRHTGGGFIHEGLSLDVAMSWAEQYALEEDSLLTERTKSWRRKPTSSKAREYAISIGLDETNVIRAKSGELSDAIGIHVVSSLLDHAL